MDSSSFSSLPLTPAMLQNLERLGFEAMTPIQQASLPISLQGKDLIAQGKTGSGKTAAFAIPILHNFDVSTLELQALVMCPTRELADQVAQEFRRIAKSQANIKIVTLTGGVLMRGQRESLAHGAHIAVGTPGRLMDLIEKGNLDLSQVKFLVLDEADLMLDMGFRESIAYVVKDIPKQRQTLMFSATYPEEVAKLIARFLKNPERITVESLHDNTTIEQSFYEVSNETRFAAATQLLLHHRPERTLAFCNTKQQCKDFLLHLHQHGIMALALHGELEQRDRDQVLVQFNNRSCSVLVATDVAARGLDIVDLDVVLNVDVPFESEQYVHRIGRTGRMQGKGLALTLVTPKETNRIVKIEDHTAQRVTYHALPQARDGGKSKNLVPTMTTLQLLVERKDKIRAGDILGALTSEGGVQSAQIGKIQIAEFSTYVAVERACAQQAFKHLQASKIKGKSVRVRML